MRMNETIADFVARSDPEDVTKEQIMAAIGQMIRKPEFDVDYLWVICELCRRHGEKMNASQMARPALRIVTEPC